MIISKQSNPTKVGLSSPDEELLSCSRLTVLSNERGSFQTFVMICPSLFTCISLEVKQGNSNSCFNAQLNSHKVGQGS